MFKRFIGIMLSALMAFSASTSAFAAESADVSNDTNIQEVDTVSTDASDRALGKLLATNATTIYGGSGTLTVTLPAAHSTADYIALIGYAEQNGLVVCSVRDPEGYTFNLGTISGTGSRTYAYNVSYAPAGTYTFTFISAMSEPFQVVAYIYD